MPLTFNSPPKSDDVPMLTQSLPPSTNNIFALPLDSTLKSTSAESSLKIAPVLKTPVVIVGAVRVLFVSVSVEAVETRATSPPLVGNVKTFVAPAECGAP